MPGYDNQTLAITMTRTGHWSMFFAHPEQKTMLMFATEQKPGQARVALPAVVDG